MALKSRKIHVRKKPKLVEETAFEQSALDEVDEVESKILSEIMPESFSEIESENIGESVEEIISEFMPELYREVEEDTAFQSNENLEDESETDLETEDNLIEDFIGEVEAAETMFEAAETVETAEEQVDTESEIQNETADDFDLTFNFDEFDEEKPSDAEEAESEIVESAEEVPAFEEKAFENNINGHSFIEFNDVKKTYIMGETEIHALDGIDFSINKGEFVIVVGASGAGKSTILNILGGMDTATSGQMFVDGEEISAYTKKQMTMYRRYDVGFVFQFYNLVQNLTARENVELATQVSKDPLDVDETIKAVGLEDRSKNFPSQLSGGEQQRVAIARALAKNPKLLLCDEPTGALDYNTGKAILKLLQDTARSNNMTVIIITHNYALTSIGDKVIRVKNGKIESVSLNEHPMDIADVEW